MAIPHISFEEFESGSMEKWALCAEKELLAPVATLPEWDLGQGAIIRPYLTKNELNTTKTGLIQEVQKRSGGWKNLPIIKRKDFGSIKKLLTKIVGRGAHGAILDLSEIVHSQHELNNFLNEISSEDNLLFLELPDSKYDILFERLTNTSRGGFVHDPVGRWMQTGKIDSDYIFKISEYSKTKNSSQQFYPLQVQSLAFHEAGANPVQELAFTLGTFVHYLDVITENDVSPEAAFSSISFSLSIGTHYFSEIAKTRALRVLIHQVAGNYGIKVDSYQPFIQCVTSNLYMDFEDEHTNLVRKSISSMSAVLGGCDALSVLSEDIVYENKMEAFDNLGQTIPLILSNEGKLNQAGDSLAGSYLMETMTEKIATAAWNLFLDIEDQGGIVKCFERGRILSDINLSYARLLQERQHTYLTPNALDKSSNIDHISKLNSESANLPKRNLADDLRKLASLNLVKA